MRKRTFRDFLFFFAIALEKKQLATMLRSDETGTTDTERPVEKITNWRNTYYG